MKKVLYFLITILLFSCKVNGQIGTVKTEEYKAEFEKKQIISMVYSGDTIIDNRKNLMITYNDYNFLSGRTKEPQIVFVTMEDSGFYMNGRQFIRTKNFKPVFKIDSLKMDESKIQKEYIEEYRKEAKKKFLSFSVSRSCCGSGFVSLNIQPGSCFVILLLLLKIELMTLLGN